MKTKDFEQMASRLYAAATQYPAWCEENTEERAVFKLTGNFVVSCLPTRPAIEAMANKLRKGPSGYKAHRAKQRR